MDLDQLTEDEELKEKIRSQLQDKGLKWDQLSERKQKLIVKNSEAAKKKIHQRMN